jgi:hypothetical protein
MLAELLTFFTSETSVARLLRRFDGLEAFNSLLSLRSIHQADLVQAYITKMLVQGTQA